MRITEGTNYRSLLQDIARVQEQMARAQAQISSGKRVHAPSDDPRAAGDIVRISGEKFEATQYERNLIFARSKLNTADIVLDNVERMIERARSLAQSTLGQTAAGPVNATEINGIRDQILSAANSAHAGKYIFGGSEITSAPYTKAADGTVTYQGNSESMAVQVSRTATIETQIPGSEIFSGAIDIFATMSDLTAAMNSGDRSAIHEQIGKLEQFAEGLSISRSKVGAYVNKAANIDSELTSANLALESDLTEAQAADLAKAITEFQLSENALQATMTVGARISQLNLLDYL